MSEPGATGLRRAPIAIVGAFLSAAGYDDVTPLHVERGVVGQTGGGDE